MKPEHAKFLFSLPLVIHVPSEHFFLVHGGLLPSDPRRPSDDERQPLAHIPSADDITSDPTEDAEYDHTLLKVAPPQSVLRGLGTESKNITDADIEEMRAVQEAVVLHDVPHNRDPWVILNIRGVRKSGKATRRGDKGKHWAKIWNGQMKRCGGFVESSEREGEGDEDEDDDRVPARFRLTEARDKDDDHDDDASLPCYPSTVVYGHAASRDLDVRRWTVGLDTGCLYGRRLTSLVLQRRHPADVDTPTRTTPTDEEEEEEEGDDEDESSDEEEDELDEYAADGPLGGLNARYARVAGGSAVSRARKPPKTWSRGIKFGDKGSHLRAKLVSVKCPKAGDFAGP